MKVWEFNFDCIDNNGLPYPSQWAADIIERSKATHSPEGTSNPMNAARSTANNRSDL